MGLDALTFPEEGRMAKIRTSEQAANMTMLEFCETFKIPEDFGIDSIPVKHPDTGEKIYYIGGVSMELWYRKKPGQAGKDGQMWPLMQGTGFDPATLEIHPDIKKELSGIGTFTSKSSLKKPTTR
ncbi:MAG: hypothetical protein WC764_04725 [Candidatus Paceibacterota bacterium]|jgi:hypothetical protein